MAADTILREKVATCTRIFAMQGLIGVFGHVSACDPGSRRVFVSPGLGSDRSTTKADGIFVLDHSGKILEPDDGDVPIEWPIHTALHAARADALAVAHVHSPYATLFTIAERELQPVTLQGALFAEGVPLYRETNLVKTPAQGRQLVETIADKRAVLMRGHGAVLTGRDLEEVLFCTLVLEDDAGKTMQAATLGNVGTISLEECRAFDAETGLQRRSHRAWNYLAGLEARWDRQSPVAKSRCFRSRDLNPREQSRSAPDDRKKNN